MAPSLAPAPFYGDTSLTLDSIRRIRFSRLFDGAINIKSPEHYERQSKSAPIKPSYRGVKLFSNVSHGVKKAKARQKKPLSKLQTRMAGKTKSAPGIRDMMREKFDFSRTHYSLPVRKPRVMLDEEVSKTRKFFKTSVDTATREAKKSEIEEAVAGLEFEDVNETEEEPFAEIKKDVSNILRQINWTDADEDDSIKPLITRQTAAESLNSISSPNKSYITLSNLSPSIEVSSFSLRRNQKQYLKKSVLQENVDIPGLHELKFESLESKKFFPVFTSSARSVLSDATNKYKKSRNLLDKAAAPNNQYQIDAGQRVIGPTECVSCGMVFDMGDPFDRLRHEKYHNNRKQIKYKGMKSENVVGYCGTDRIILIKHSEEKKRKKVLEILKITEEDIGIGYTFESSSLAFLYIRNDCVLGCLIAERNVSASRVIHSNGIVLLSENRQKVKCGINRVWVQSEFRNQKIATKLVNCLRKNFVFGEMLEMDDLAFSPTTPDGDAFAIKYCGRPDYLTYEGSNIAENY